MNNKEIIHKTLMYLIATVWVINGLFCKLLNFVPRHQLIVSEILGYKYGMVITKAIGLSEILMALWILSSIKSRVCTITQIIIVFSMNIIEFFLAPDFLLFGKFNLVIALCFIGILFYNEFVLNKRALQHT